MIFEIENRSLLDTTDQVPHLAEYFGLWAMLDDRFIGLADQARKLDLHLHLNAESVAAASAAAAKQAKPFVADQVAIITIRGTMMKHASSFSSGTSTVAIRQALREAVRDQDVGAIVLKIDSPGGTVSGMQDLADEIQRSSQRKPVYAYVEDLGASAAYWAASQARDIWANTMAHVGSIGTYGVINDYSALAAKEGIKVHVVRAGQYKGMGTPGTEISAEQLAELQRLVNEANDFFLAGVARGRGHRLPLAAVQAIADGRVHVGEKAKGLGLIDRIGTFDELMAHVAGTLRGGNSTTRTTREDPMDPKQTTSTTPQPATHAEIKAACPGASADFILAQLEAAATVDQAGKAWMKQLADANAKQTEELTKLRAQQAENEKRTTTGVEPLEEGKGKSKTSAAAGDPIARWESLIADHMALGRSKQEAVRHCVNHNKDEHKAYLQAYNARHPNISAQRNQLATTPPQQL